jgi:hypothetical protein
MNSKRKADLQRKLSLAQVPTPPAGLAERLKNDIPSFLPATMEQERQRFSRSIGFNMRVAASILLMISSVYLALRIASHGDTNRLAYTAVPNRVPVNTAKPALPSHIEKVAQQPAPAAAAAPVPQPTIYMLEGTTVVARKDQVEEADTRNQPASRLDRRELEAAKPSPPADFVSEPSGYARAATDEGQAKATESISVTASAPMMAPAPLPAEAAVAQSAAAAPMTERSAKRMAGPAAAMAPPPPVVTVPASTYAPVADGRLSRNRDLVKAASAADLSFDASSNALFGISVDRHAFDRVKSSIERGERPEAEAIDVDALVNYFAGHAPHSPREVDLEAEGSPGPVPLNPLRQIVRFTMDTASAPVADGGSVPPVATNVKIEITFDPGAVASQRRIGGGDITAASESTLLKNASVTALYEVELRPGLRARQTVAKVRLSYRSVTDGRERTIERTLLRQDLARTWSSASRRHRLASLGAVWGETLKGNAGQREVARRAEELAHQSPNDSKARELADVASASSRLSNTPSTGSGR